VESGKDVSASVELFHRVNEQDFDACERCQPAMGSKIYAKGGGLNRVQLARAAGLAKV
jgi:Rieske 2Fe-2S family protein